jgi:YfiH family protein
VCRSIWQNQYSNAAVSEIADHQNLVTDLLPYSTFSTAGLVSAKQVHGNHVEPVHKAGVIENCDGLMTDTCGLPLLIKTADCAAVMIYAEKQNIIANLHVGWRGAAAGIISKTIQTLSGGLQAEIHSMWVAVGPLLRDCCYEVGEDFYQIFQNKYLMVRGKRLFFHLQEVIQDQLLMKGILPEKIEFSGECTHCSPRELPSYRRSKTRNRLFNLIEKKEK